MRHVDDADDLAIAGSEAFERLDGDDEICKSLIETLVKIIPVDGRRSGTVNAALTTYEDFGRAFSAAWDKAHTPVCDSDHAPKIVHRFYPTVVWYGKSPHEIMCLLCGANSKDGEYFKGWDGLREHAKSEHHITNDADEETWCKKRQLPADDARRVRRGNALGVPIVRLGGTLKQSDQCGGQTSTACATTSKSL